MAKTHSHSPPIDEATKETDMLISTTNTIEGRTIVTYYGLVTGEAVLGANVFRDLFAGVRDIVGGRSGAYEKVLKEARDTAIAEMACEATELGANAVIAVDLDYETVHKGTMLMVSATGTAIAYT